MIFIKTYDSLLDRVSTNKLPEEYLDLRHLATWITQRTLRRINLNWFNNYSIGAESANRALLAKQVKEYNQAYFATSWWSFKGFFKKLFLLLFWLEQEKRSRYLARLEWADFVKINITGRDQLNPADQLDEMSRVRWPQEVGGAIQAYAEMGRFFDTVNDFGVLLCKDCLISPEQKQAIALDVLDYMVATEVYKFDLTNKITLEAIKQTLATLQSFKKISNKKFYTYVEFAKINTQIFLQSIPQESADSDRYLESFFSGKILQGKIARQYVERGQSLCKKYQAISPSYSSVEASFAPAVKAATVSGEKPRFLGIMREKEIILGKKERQLEEKDRQMEEKDKVIGKKDDELKEERAGRKVAEVKADQERIVKEAALAEVRRLHALFAASKSKFFQPDEQPLPKDREEYSSSPPGYSG